MTATKLFCLNSVEELAEADLKQDGIEIAKMVASLERISFRASSLVPSSITAEIAVIAANLERIADELGVKVS